MSLVDLNYEKKNFQQALDYSMQALELKPTNITYVLATAAIYDAMWDISRAQDFYAYVGQFRLLASASNQVSLDWLLGLNF